MENATYSINFIVQDARQHDCFDCKEYDKGMTEEKAREYMKILTAYDFADSNPKNHHAYLELVKHEPAKEGEDDEFETIETKILIK